jgi:plastocyanin
MRPVLLAASALVLSSLTPVSAQAVEARSAALTSTALTSTALTSTALGSAAGAVTVQNMTFGPAAVTVGVGETVTWTFVDAMQHTATSDNGFFNTGLSSNGQQRTVRFRSSGTYPYHCIPHPHMTGRVRVPVRASGSRADGWKLVWLVGDNPRGRSYDVQVRRVGTSTWKSFRSRTTRASGRFDPGRGSWQVRARTWKGASKSQWSPTSTLP